jgi:hypothetical protein
MNLYINSITTKEDELRIFSEAEVSTVKIISDRLPVIRTGFVDMPDIARPRRNSTVKHGLEIENS